MTKQLSPASAKAWLAGADRSKRTVPACGSITGKAGGFAPPVSGDSSIPVTKDLLELLESFSGNSGNAIIGVSGVSGIIRQ
jgi:hypothetical protein